MQSFALSSFLCLHDNEVAHKLQRCQTTAARLILQQSFTPSIQDLMNQLHWLPIQARIDFKIATLT